MLCPSTMHLRPGFSRVAMPTRVSKSAVNSPMFLHQHPLTARAAVAAVVERIGDQSGLAEPLRDVVVTAGMLAETVRQHHHRTRRDVRRPDVVDDAHAADAVEIPFSAGGSHYGQRTG